MAIKLLPTKIDFYLNRAYTNRKMKEFKEAIKDYDKVIQIEKNNVKAFYNRGLCYEKINMYEKAEKNLIQCLIIENNKNIKNKNGNNNANIYYHLANIQDKLNKMKEAEEGYLRLLN